jgi:hypothetical protein
MCNINIFNNLEATEHGEGEICVALLAKHKDTDINAQSISENGVHLLSNSVKCFGNTALHYSALRGDVSSVEILLNVGANPNIRNNLGQSSLHCYVTGM